MEDIDEIDLMAELAAEDEAAFKKESDSSFSTFELRVIGTKADKNTLTKETIVEKNKSLDVLLDEADRLYADTDRLGKFPKDTKYVFIEVNAIVNIEGEEFPQTVSNRMLEIEN